MDPSDNAFGRIMTYDVVPSATNTNEKCIDTCQTAGFMLAGTDYGQECYCSNSLTNGAILAQSEADCSMLCAGDNTHSCAAGNRISLYASVDTFPSHPVPTVNTTNMVGQYQYAGCHAEPGALRFLLYQINDPTDMTVEKCQALCSMYGYDAAGLEYGEECWCGDVATISEKGGVPAPEEECNLPCSGSPIDLCGGAQRYNLYTWTSETSPLYVWSHPENTGCYELLIGGIVIPLISALRLNDKVIFLEKYGTGAPNSTDAYES